MAVGDIFRVGIVQTLHAQTVVNILHYRQTVDDGGAPSNAAKLASSIIATIVPAMKAVQSSELVHDWVTCQKIWPLPPNLTHIDVGGAGAAGVAIDSLPTSVAVVITKLTNFAGPKYRGRMYVAGLPEEHEADSQLAPGQVANWETLGTLLDDNLSNTGDSWSPVIWHRDSSTWDVVTSHLVRPRLRNQRRRQIGVGI